MTAIPDDIIVRPAGRLGWLGLLVGEGGRETYRTGKHHQNPESALAAVLDWIASRPKGEGEQ